MWLELHFATHILTEGDNEGHNVVWIYININLFCYCIDFWLYM